MAAKERSIPGAAADAVARVFANASASAKPGLKDELLAALKACPEAISCKGPTECVEALLARGGFEVDLSDAEGNTALHLAAASFPMCSYLIAKASPGSCLLKNASQQTPSDAATSKDRGEVLNAMLLACSGNTEANSAESAMEAMRLLLQEGAVPDTWAPNGSSALMLAAAANSTKGIQLMLANGATLELQDALGRTSLMFAVGNNAEAAVKVLLTAGASLSQRDRRGRNVLDYAPEDSNVKVLLVDRLKVLEEAAEKLQTELLADLESEEAVKRPKKKKKQKRKKGGDASVAAAAAVAEAPRQGCKIDAAESATAQEEGITELLERSSSEQSEAAAAAAEGSSDACCYPSAADTPETPSPAALEPPFNKSPSSARASSASCHPAFIDAPESLTSATEAPSCHTAAAHASGHSQPLTEAILVNKAPFADSDSSGDVTASQDTYSTSTAASGELPQAGDMPVSHHTVCSRQPGEQLSNGYACDQLSQGEADQLSISKAGSHKPGSAVTIITEATKSEASTEPEDTSQASEQHGCAASSEQSETAAHINWKVVKPHRKSSAKPIIPPVVPSGSTLLVGTPDAVDRGLVLRHCASATSLADSACSLESRDTSSSGHSRRSALARGGAQQNARGAASAHLPKAARQERLSAFKEGAVVSPSEQIEAAPQCVASSVQSADSHKGTWASKVAGSMTRRGGHKAPLEPSFVNSSSPTPSSSSPIQDVHGLQMQIAQLQLALTSCEDRHHQEVEALRQASAACECKAVEAAVEAAVQRERAIFGAKLASLSRTMGFSAAAAGGDMMLPIGSTMLPPFSMPVSTPAAAAAAFLQVVQEPQSTPVPAKSTPPLAKSMPFPAKSHAAPMSRTPFSSTGSQRQTWTPRPDPCSNVTAYDHVASSGRLEDVLSRRVADITSQCAGCDMTGSPPLSVFDRADSLWSEFAGGNAATAFIVPARSGPELPLHMY